MTTFLIGDFRLRQFQAEESLSLVVNDNLKCNDYTKEHCTHLLNVDTTAVFMLGFNDCVESCLHSDFNLEAAATNYITIINELVNDYPTTTFYVCAVNPVDYDYTHIKNKIAKEQLIAAIEYFNNIVSSQCVAQFIDSYSYLMSTGFRTRDGIHFFKQTCSLLTSYIKQHINPEELITNFKVDNNTSDHVKCSFIATESVILNYRLIQGNHLSLENSFEASKGINHLELTELVPNTSYELTIYNDTDSVGVISFITQQEYPTLKATVKLIPQDRDYRNDVYALNVNDLENLFGCWETNGCGFAIFLFINGQEKASYFVDTLPDTISVKELFNYEPLSTDTLQLGLSSWVNYENIKLFSNYILSNSVCKTISPVDIFINNKIIG